MRLLIVTQAVDTQDPVLGFFHAWIEELAQRVESIEVICLKEGKHALPSNVAVHSLGKEKGKKGKTAYALSFLSLAWRLRGRYDAVFVHMNQEYLLIAGWLWKLLGKRAYLWRNHYAGSFLTDLAALFCTKLFYTSDSSYTAKYAHAAKMPVGVDTKRFRSGGERAARSVLFLARMAPSKRPDLVLAALELLATDGVEFTATFAGAPLPEHEAYYNALVERAKALPQVRFVGAVSHEKAAELFRAHQVFVNASPSGMLDKTIFEAAASGCTSLYMSEDAKGLFGATWWFSDAVSLAALLRATLGGERSDQDKVLETQSLDRLGAILSKTLQTA